MCSRHTPMLQPAHTAPLDTLSISSLSPEELHSSPAAPVKEGLSTCAFPAEDDRRGSAGWAGAPHKSGSRTFPVRTNLRLSLVFQSQAKPRPGDLIEIFRFGYGHWAIYVGDGYVVHLAPLSKDGLCLSTRGKMANVNSCTLVCLFSPQCLA